MINFKIGDIVKPLPSANYGITNSINKWEGRIIRINNDETFAAETTKIIHPPSKYEGVGCVWDDLDPKYFEIAEINWKKKMEGLIK